MLLRPRATKDTRIDIVILQEIRFFFFQRRFITYSNTLAYNALLSATRSWSPHRINADAPAIHTSTNDPPNASGHIKADRQNARKQRKNMEYGAGAFRSASSSSDAVSALISS